MRKGKGVSEGCKDGYHQVERSLKCCEDFRERKRKGFYSTRGIEGE